MAIEPIRKVTLISPRDSHERLMKTINRLGVMEVTDLKDIQEAGEPSSPTLRDENGRGG